jgi:ergothioneine biosynthesis protein EgtB
MSSTRNAKPAESLRERYLSIRRATERLVGPLSPEDCAVQSMPDASPAKWHLAHTSWFFETFVLESGASGYAPFDPAYRFLFNSYYNTVGEQYTRADRGLLTRPSLEEVRSYRAHVDEHMDRFLDDIEPSSGAADVVELGLNHEQQHQELILTDVKHLLAINPLRPAYAGLPEAPPAEAAPLEWHAYDAGVAWIGYDGDGFCFDNERPRHRQFVGAVEIASRLATNGEFLEFVEDGGYSRSDLWLSDGWSAVRANGWEAPLYWERHGDGWSVMTLGGLRELRRDEPVCHVSFFEAEAFARWAGARLPTEFEWEQAAGAAGMAGMAGNFVESGLLHPAPVRASTPGSPAQLFGDVWEWTASAYSPYRRFKPASGALGEYNGKFMCSQLVLRGGSCATPSSHIRATYRNFFPPAARWQFSGIRLARDV